MEQKYNRFYEVIRQVPRGKVATYGQIAEMAGFPGAARQVGHALFRADLEDVPWQRIINSRGRISLPEPESREQRKLLEAEGIVFSPAGSVSLSLYRWQPDWA